MRKGKRTLSISTPAASRLRTNSLKPVLGRGDGGEAGWTCAKHSGDTKHFGSALSMKKTDTISQKFSWQ